MARLLPPYVAPDTPSPGERFLFGKLKNDKGTDGWVVFHSFGIAKHPSRLAGEIDFVVIVPQVGILCLEIKAGQVGRRDGVWEFGSGASRRTSAVGPFRQASDAMHALRDHVAKRAPDLGRLLFYSGAVFTDIDFDEHSPEWHPWQFFGRSELNRSSISTCCMRILDQAHQHTAATASARWYHDRHSRPDQDQVDRLVKFLRPDFEYGLTPRITVEHAEDQITRFTEEQFSALDVIEHNPRVLFMGPAGTGKTFLGMEAVHRSRLRGESTLFTCYNRLLGLWLNLHGFANEGGNDEDLTVGTFHSLLLRLSGLRAPSGRDQSEFWSHILPTEVIERALSNKIVAPAFSFLCVDEAQDLLTPDYLDVMDLLLEGGLVNGRWAMFGDFENQAIYSRLEEETTAETRKSPKEEIKSRGSVFFTFPLRVNCRNTPQIAAGLELACSLDPGYSRVLATLDGQDIDVEFTNSRSESIQTLRRLLVQLKKQFKPGEIVVLSERDDSHSTAHFLSIEDPGMRLGPLRDEGSFRNRIGFSTIHAFKGLEAPAVILTDVVRIRGTDAQNLLYVGMSRARLHLKILMHDSCRDDWISVVQQGFLRKKTDRRN
ncbi:ATP-binding domain-containing protein [bacterium]|nr:ATP-binding domain-containing protein [bacterium]